MSGYSCLLDYGMRASSHESSIEVDGIWSEQACYARPMFDLLDDMRDWGPVFEYRAEKVPPAYRGLAHP
jgi:hypothetical protein